MRCGDDTQYGKGHQYKSMVVDEEELWRVFTHTQNALEAYHDTAPEERTLKAIIYHPFTSHSNDVVWGTRLIVPAPFSSASLMAYVFNTLRCQIDTA